MGISGTGSKFYILYPGVGAWGARGPGPRGARVGGARAKGTISRRARG